MIQYTYLLVDIGCILVPFLFSFHPRLQFHKEWKYILPAYTITALFFIVWDMIFTGRGVWWFRADYLLGINVYNIPLEEIFFFICIPYACIFTYHSLKVLIPNNPWFKFRNILNILLIIISLTMVILGWGRDYTFWTGLFNLILFSITYWKKIDISFILLSYIAVIPFFLLSNGILTGSFLEAPVVNYNDAENLGIRIFTIPIEDTMYGFLFIALVALGYEWKKGKIINR
jgi:lycopene cyclase domain-containing protein